MLLPEDLSLDAAEAAFASASRASSTLRGYRSDWAEFVTGCNHEHHHKGIGLHTPADVHYGPAAAKADDRAQVLTAARALNPQRFTTDRPPKILALPEAA